MESGGWRARGGEVRWEVAIFENAPSQKSTIVKVGPAPAKIGVVKGKGEEKLGPSPTTLKSPTNAEPPSPAKAGETHGKLAPSPSKPKPKNDATSSAPSDGKLKPGSEGKPAAPPPKR